MNTYDSETCDEYQKRIEEAKDMLMRQCEYEGVKRAVYREALESYFRLIK